MAESPGQTITFFRGVVGSTQGFDPCGLGSSPGGRIKQRLFLIKRFWAKLYTTRFKHLGCSYIGLLHRPCTPDRGVRLPYGPLETNAQLTQH